MAGFREFAAGEPLTSANVNNFLMKQSVMVFADAAARTAALGAAVAEGMLTYNEDTSALEVFDGINFVAAGAPGVPAGTVIYHAASTAPTGFVKANGANLNRTTFADLFAAIGTVFGVGDGSTTFGVPDLRAEFVRGFDDGRAVDSGRVFGSAQGHLFASHSHNLVQRTGSGTARFPPLAANSGTLTSLRTDNEGGAETRPINVALLACIKF